MTQSEEIFQWLEDNRDYFKSEGICKQLGIDKGNFSKYKSTKLIPEKYIVPIIGIITLYGFKSKVLGQWVDKKDLPKSPENGKEYFEEQVSKITTPKEKRIEAILAEKIPEHRNTRLGKLSWQIEQKKRIVAIQNEKDG